MEYIQLGDSDLRVSRLALGTMTWGAQNSAKVAFAQMDFALERGVQFWDTAEMYAVPKSAKTYGTTESIIGDWFAATGRRAEVILATKFSPLPWARPEGLINANKKSLPLAVENSLKRLKTDYIDLYQLHWPTNRPHIHGASVFHYQPPKASDARARIVDDIHESLTTLAQLVKQGKIRYIGLSNDSAWGIMQYLRLAEQHGLPRIVSLQNEYSLLRRSFDFTIAETSALEQISLIGWSPLAMGVLSGKYLGGQRPTGTRFSPEVLGEEAEMAVSRLHPKVHQVVTSYLEVAQRHHVDPCQMAIKFCVRQPHLSCTIIGATTMAQLENNIEAISLDFTDALYADIQAVWRANPLPF